MDEITQAYGQDKINQVYDILCTPIECTQHSGFKDERKESIEKEKGVIKTTQTYWPEYIDKDTREPFRYKFIPDYDMSDFACGFYEIIYKDLLNGNSIIADNGCFVDKNNAGDTITSVSQLPGLRNRYHCLANFWMIPMEIGRQSKHNLSKTSSKYCIEDYMNRFLLLLKYRYVEYKSSFPDYFSESRIDSFEKMSYIHFLEESYIDKNYDIKQYSDVINKSTEEYLWKCIKKRAEKISNSKFGLELWEYFDRNNLFETR